MTKKDIIKKIEEDFNYHQENLSSLKKDELLELLEKLEIAQKLDKMGVVLKKEIEDYKIEELNLLANINSKNTKTQDKEKEEVKLEIKNGKYIVKDKTFNYLGSALLYLNKLKKGD